MVTTHHSVIARCRQVFGDHVIVNESHIVLPVRFNGLVDGEPQIEFALVVLAEGFELFSKQDVVFALEKLNSLASSFVSAHF